MAIKLGNTDINKVYLGSTEINKLYLGSNLILDNSGSSGGTNLYTAANVLSVDNEANSTSGIGRLATTISHASVETTVVRNGTYSAKFDINQQATISFVSIDLEFNGDGTYELSFWVYSTDAGQRVRTITNTNQGEYFLPQTTNTWEQFTLTFDIDSGATTGNLEIGRGITGASFYLDELTLIKQ